jgi:hypothetical protein
LISPGYGIKPKLGNFKHASLIALFVPLTA